MDKLYIHRPGYSRLAFFAVVLAFVVITLGAFTRLQDAGLGCPDWPGCYGQVAVPTTQADVKKAVKAFPAKPVEAGKAWDEMIHRYVAGTLGGIVLVLGGWAFLRRSRKKDSHQPIFVPTLLLGLIALQVALGMWTVTLLVMPLVVMSHLMMGMTIISLLWWLALRSGHHLSPLSSKLSSLRPWAVLTLVIVVLQIFLGAWTSTNYASIICPHFPFCRGSLFPNMDVLAGFNLMNPIGVNYEGGVLHEAARIAIQMMHRYGAVVTALFVGATSFYLMFSEKTQGLRRVGLVMLVLLLVQFLLGVLNIVLLLPLPIAVAHNGVAALLLLSVVTYVYKVFVKTGEHHV